MVNRLSCWFVVGCVLAALAFDAAPSGAWFSGSWTTGSAIITSGSLDLQVTGGPLKATNLKPGEDHAPLGVFCLKNTGTITLRYKGQFESPVSITHQLLRYTTLKVEQHTTGHWVTVQEIVGTAAIETDSLPYYFKHPGQAPETVNHAVIHGELAANDRLCYRLSVMLDPHTPNSEQGRAIDFVLHLDATQVNNPAWE
jgi:hypothetical protein